MKDAVYDAVVALCVQRINGGQDLEVGDCEAFPTETLDALLAVFRQRYRTHIKQTAHVHRTPAAKAECLEAYAGGEGIASIAERRRFSPFLMARLFIEWLLGVPKKEVGRTVKARHAIADDRLRAEVQYCVDMDQYTSPFVDRIRMSVGQEYEFVLQQTLRGRGIPFHAEDELRARGMSKTPDVLLAVPIGVPTAGGARVVHWIDSKAMFGDRRTQLDIADQVAGYINRYGPGMVIYWHDCVDSLTDADTDPDVVIAKRFPPAVVLPGAVDLCVDPPLFPLGADVLSVTY